MRAWVAAVVALMAPTGAAGTDAVSAPAREALLPRISAVDCRYVADEIWGNEAAALNERLVVTRCVPKGRRSRVCRVRVGRHRFYLSTRYANALGEPIGEARRLADVSAATGSVPGSRR